MRNLELEIEVEFAGSNIKADSTVIWQFHAPASEVANVALLLKFWHGRFTLFVLGVEGDAKETKPLKVGRGFFGGINFSKDLDSKFKILMPLDQYKWRTEDLMLLQDRSFKIRLVQREP